MLVNVWIQALFFILFNIAKLLLMHSGNPTITDSRTWNYLMT